MSDIIADTIRFSPEEVSLIQGLIELKKKAGAQGMDACKSALMEELVKYAKDVRGNLGSQKSKVYNMRFRSATYEQLKSLAAEKNISMPALIVEALRNMAEKEYPDEWKGLIKHSPKKDSGAKQ